MKRIFAFALLAVMLFSLFAPAAYADEEETAATEAEEESLGGWLSDNFRWELDSDGTLTISGEGIMPGEAPWRDYSEQVKTLFFDGNIYTVTGGAFRDCTNLKEVQFSPALTQIGDYAFLGCTSIEAIHLPEGFRQFGISCFGGCTSLTKVYCRGYMPHFSEACLANGGEITVYYSEEKPWKESDTEPLARAYGGLLTFQCQDSAVPMQGANEEEETAPPATEAPTVPTTVATEPSTVPPTTLPEPTVPETTVPVVILDETVPGPTVHLVGPTEATEAAVEEETVKGSLVGLVLIVGVLTFFIVGGLVFRTRSKGGRY